MNYWTPYLMKLKILLDLVTYIARPTCSNVLIFFLFFSFLNRRKNMPLAYASLLCALALCVPLGITLRNTNYVNADFSDVVKGGLVFDSKTKTRSVLLVK